MDDQEEQYFRWQKTGQRTGEHTQVRSGSACPQCQAINDDDARYCSECGSHLLAAGSCPNCHSDLKPGADICESCKTWLRVGQCMFCNAAVAPDDAYCSECGNPTAGITCSQCGQLSIFDYCPHCQTPLTEQARHQQRQMSEEPGISALADIAAKLQALDSVTNDRSESFSSATSAERDEADQQLRKLAELRAAARGKRSTPAPRAEPLFSSEDKARVSRLEKDIEVERRRQAEEKQRQEERRQALITQAENALQEMLQTHQHRRFANSQEARCFYMSMLSAFPKEIIEALDLSAVGRAGWLCNEYGNLHNDPSECAAPHAGGVWVYK